VKAIIFDLDGTLVDSVYGHVLAWQRAFQEGDAPIEGWRIHRHIGMSGEQMMEAVLKERGWKLSGEQKKRIEERHVEFLHELLPDILPLPGTAKLLQELKDRNIPHAIATSGNQKDLEHAVKHLNLARETVVVFRRDVPAGKPQPDLFIEAQKRLGVPAIECYAVGDAVWDLIGASRAGMIPIGILTGGNAEAELRGAGAVGVFTNPQSLLASLYSFGLGADETDRPRSQRRHDANLRLRTDRRRSRRRHTGPEGRTTSRSARLSRR
jgi:HAD superfamily hydrolase (TIGR01509 family)